MAKPVTFIYRRNALYDLAVPELAARIAGEGYRVDGLHFEQGTPEMKIQLALLQQRAALEGKLLITDHTVSRNLPEKSEKGDHYAPVEVLDSVLGRAYQHELKQQRQAEKPGFGDFAARLDWSRRDQLKKVVERAARYIESYAAMTKKLFRLAVEHARPDTIYVVGHEMYHHEPFIWAFDQRQMKNRTHTTPSLDHGIKPGPFQLRWYNEEFCADLPTTPEEWVTRWLKGNGIPVTHVLPASEIPWDANILVVADRHWAYQFIRGKGELFEGEPVPEDVRKIAMDRVIQIPIENLVESLCGRGIAPCNGFDVSRVHRRAAGSLIHTLRRY